MTSRKTLSVIVPAYNEENYIGACLDALLAQQTHLREIVVVDNNSTDGTAEIVARVAAKHPVVRLVREPAPGAVHARNAGFAAATGDVLGRIDADTRVESDWCREVLDFFERPDTEKVGVVTGLSNSYDSPYRRIKGWYVRRLVSKGVLGGEQRIRNLHGANMAMRRETWEQVRASTSRDRDVHEDVDLALCVGEAGWEIAQLSQMRADLSPRRALTPPREFSHYLEAGVKTLERHNAMTPQRRRLLRLHWVTHLGAYLAYRPYDPDRHRFTLRRLIFGGPARTMPVTFDEPLPA
ncbi:glycosyltransferase [Rhodococcus sp. SGAir0479]|uniref:glycosyltransferase n=1 Tax=Rhodococcus sp. SGAir0479 TaxID=2567884 RepID=UPI0010CCC287|nr:glycosyltransferase [Rhodococcus sp. SGAir0479]QCQ93286.1 glycosyltransferase [Rhodococcus sp. SGAir0479]